MSDFKDDMHAYCGDRSRPLPFLLQEASTFSQLVDLTLEASRSQATELLAALLGAVAHFRAGPETERYTVMGETYTVIDLGKLGLRSDVIGGKVGAPDSVLRANSPEEIVQALKGSIDEERAFYVVLAALWYWRNRALSPDSHQTPKAP